MRRLLLTVALVAMTAAASAQGAPTRDEALAALQKAVRFYAEQVGRTGPYVWRYAGDLSIREGEGKATPSIGWVQPPGMPAVGWALLDAYEATGEQAYLEAAIAVAHQLVKGQLHTGGWYYHLELDPAKREEYLYRDLPKRKVGRSGATTTLDDNTTQAAVRFLMRIDGVLEPQDEAIHEAAAFCLEALLAAQYPAGGWYQNWRTAPKPPSAADFPVVPASYPQDWSRNWLNDWPGRYYLNDNVLMDMVDVMLDAYDAYGDERYWKSALKGGDFLILAQMPDPQPAWAQQYDNDMHPCWDRKFEPPAISGRESQDAMVCLIKLYRLSGEGRYLAPIPRALTYLRGSLLPDGKLARFYELQTNKPLYFDRDYQLTYDPAQSPQHYGFIWESHLDAIEAAYNRAVAGEPEPEPAAADLAPLVRQAIDGMDGRGAWVVQGMELDAHDMEPASGVILSETFIANVSLLCAYLKALN